jgi:hypothetical protein
MYEQMVTTRRKVQALKYEDPPIVHRQRPSSPTLQSLSVEIPHPRFPLPPARTVGCSRILGSVKSFPRLLRPFAGCLVWEWLETDDGGVIAVPFVHCPTDRALLLGCN